MIELSRDWVKHGRCRKASTREFFLPTGRATDSSMAAFRYCERCPVRTICFCYALIRGERGIWGGTTEQERDARRPHILDIIVDLWPELMETHEFSG